MTSQDEQDLKAKARDIYGCKENVVRYIIKSNGSVEYTPKREGHFLQSKKTQS